MKIYKTRIFARWAKKAILLDSSLWQAALEVQQGKIDAYYGANLYKKRIANKNRGKSISTRAMLCYESNNKLVFLYGFEKSEQPNISIKEKKMLQILARDILNLDEKSILNRLETGSLIEVENEQNL